MVLGVGEAVGFGAGFDDVAAEGESVDDRSAEPGISERFRPAGERFVGRDRDGVFLFPLGEDLEKEFSATAVEFHIAKLVNHE